VLHSEHNFGDFHGLSGCVSNLEAVENHGRQTTPFANQSSVEIRCRANRMPYQKSNTQTERAAAVLRPFERVSLAAA
jgi:hypothetical protein